ncbi:MAG: PEP-CTERM sorting domain-containing protein, partial [Planctomycetales bacterium]|nr:PEP-CTERM sorting domain-containing protein [Planctomycetales bacterium]
LTGEVTLGSDPAAAIDAIKNVEDRIAYVRDVVGTWMGDSNLDGEFNSSDFVQVFTEGKYETGQAATWASGDWNGDGEFTSADFVVAFTDGGYELGPRGGVAAVPEPCSIVLIGIGLLGMLRIRRK